MALGSTQPLTEMSTRNILGCKGRPACMVNNLAAIYEPIVYKMWEPQHLTTLWASMACYRDSYFLYFYIRLSKVKNSHHLRKLRFLTTPASSSSQQTKEKIIVRVWTKFPRNGAPLYSGTQVGLRQSALQLSVGSTAWPLRSPDLIPLLFFYASLRVQSTEESRTLCVEL
jgi:hypothetical protein